MSASVPPALPEQPRPIRRRPRLGHPCKRSLTDILLNCKNARRRRRHRGHGSLARRTAPAGRMIGYARVSTDDQGTDAQLDELPAAGCAETLEEHGSGSDRYRPVLARLLRSIRAGDTLVVVRLDRLARSVSHLLAVIEQLDAAGAHFRSLRDPIDTSCSRNAPASASAGSARTAAPLTRVWVKLTSPGQIDRMKGTGSPELA